MTTYIIIVKVFKIDIRIVHNSLLHTLNLNINII